MERYIRSILIMLFIAWTGIIQSQTFIQQGDQLIGTGVTPQAEQGYSVAISSDGKTAIVGGISDNSEKGAVWVYTKEDGIWKQQGDKLIKDTSYDINFGYSVSISGDGNTAIIGGMANDLEGGAWVFFRENGVWKQQGNKLLGTGSTGAARQGRSVHISGDGNTAIVGGPSDNNGIGASWIFIRENGVWKQQGNKIVGTGFVGKPYQGYSVSISSDGKTAIVGGIYDNDSHGSAWVFVKENGVWKQQGSKLFGITDSKYENQGSAVSISADGNTAIIGAPKDKDGIGAAWIFAREKGLWSQQGNKLVGSGSKGFANQGCAVSISADGNTAIAGGYTDDYYRGAVWIYERVNGVWKQQGNKLVGTGAVGAAAQGFAVSISGNGNTAIVGGYYDNNHLGAAWAFIRENGVWKQQGNKLVGAGAVGQASQGESVAISADGNIAIVGGPYDAYQQGAFWIFTRENGVWKQQGNKLLGTGAIGNAMQGSSVSISADGNTAIIGGIMDNNGTGAVWIFIKENGIWKQQGGKLVGSDVSGNAQIGSSVSISSDGNTVITGGPYDKNNSEGASWIFTREDGVWKQQGKKLIGTGADYALQGHSVSISSDGNTAIVGGWRGDEWNGAAWIFVRENGMWKQQGNKLVGTDYSGEPEFGYSVSISADGNTAIIGGIGDNNNNGAAWIFVRENGVWKQQGNKLVGTCSPGQNLQGFSVSISADGNIAIVGGPQDNGGIGAAWIFTRENKVWKQLENKLVGAGTFDWTTQGISVSISSDGNTAIVGGPGYNSAKGAAWVYVKQAKPIILNISGKVTLDGNGLQNVKLFLWDKTGLPYKTFTSPALTDASGNYIFRNVPAADSLQVFLMEPLGYQADKTPKPLPAINKNNPDITNLNFILTKTLKKNLAQSSDYWADQFRYYASGKHGASPDESETQILKYIKEVQDHYTPYFNIFQNLKTISDWYSVFNYQRRLWNFRYSAKAELASLVLNIASLKLPQYYVTTRDDRTAGEALTYASQLIMNDNLVDELLAYHVAYKINTRQMLARFIVPKSNVLYKLSSPDAEETAKLKVPEQYKLYSNYPNPFNPMTNIEFDIASQSYISLVIYDINGREIERLADKMMQPGHYSLQWNASKYPSGMYICTFTAGSYREVKKMILLR